MLMAKGPLRATMGHESTTNPRAPNDLSNHRSRSPLAATIAVPPAHFFEHRLRPNPAAMGSTRFFLCTPGTSRRTDAAAAVAPFYQSQITDRIRSACLDAGWHTPTAGSAARLEPAMTFKLANIPRHHDNHGFWPPNHRCVSTILTCRRQP
jgi:hypothetical protein